MAAALRPARISAIISILLFTGPLWAAQVPAGHARMLAARVLAAQVPQLAGLQAEQLVLADQAVDPASDGGPATVLFRIYNVAAGTGFAIISGDDLVLPVLGYSGEGAFAAGALPSNLAKWLEGYKQEIRAALMAGTAPAPAVQAEWQRWAHAEAGSTGERAAVAPLLQTTWNQSPYYNALCPGGSVTGCVATAMAQVMKYHNWPAQGTGFHSYNSGSYGTLSANFGATTYNWAAMPNNVTSANAAVATLMFHCGVGVDMSYSPQVSGAWVIQANSQGTDHNAEYALKTYFNYSSDLQGKQRANFTEAQWINMLKADLDASRPVLYDGFGSGGGHCFVADGYDNNNFFHFNWGWGGAYDGNFAVGALNPDGQGTGGGTGAYNNGQEAIFGIKPPSGGGTGPQQTFSMGLYAAVMPSAGTISYGQAFSVNTNIMNTGTNNFSGDYCAAVFDANSNFYGFVQTLTGYTLPAGYVYNNNLVFSTTGLLSMLPGTYYIAVCYRPTNGEWVLVDDNAGYTNLAQVVVVNPNNIELNADISASPGMSVAQGAQVSITTNIVNDGFSTFTGQYSADLYDMDGNWVQEIGVLNENNGLPAGYTYQSPGLTFGPAAITAAPGTYLLAIEHNPSNSGWQLTGSSYHANPVFFTVTAPAIAPDPYEPDNTVAQPYALPVNFSGNSATVATTGSNFHSPTDQDYYKLVLPPNYSYSISGRLHDAYNSGNGQTYTVDAMFSTSLDGTTWSAVYDDIMPGSINLANGGTVYFHVAPYFQGMTGTYLLQLNVARNGTVDVAGVQAASELRIFPNPAQTQVTVELPGQAAAWRFVELLDAQGRTVAAPQAAPAAGSRFTMGLEGVAPGAYLVRLVTEAGTFTRRLIIAR